MTSSDCRIENLMKVSLNLQGVDSLHTKAPGDRFEFIYGVGPEGITPFEKALYGKGVGDRITFNLPPGGLCQHMGHLELPLREQTGITKAGDLQVVVIGVARAADREVVKAMAAGGSCSDCDCGCGGH